MAVRRIPRHELDSDQISNRSSTPDSALEANLRERLRQVYEVPVHQASELDEECDVSGDVKVGSRLDGGSNDEEEYEFRLFSKPRRDLSARDEGSVPQKVSIRSPSPIGDEPRFLVPQRPQSYYFSGPLDRVQAEQIRAAALSGESVLNGLKLRSWGCELPWRVTVATSIKPITNLNTDRLENSPASKSRKRKGKKRRIAIRRKMQAEDVKKLRAKMSQIEKEAALREKRTRKNREQKVKRKQKEKLKKTGAIQDIG